MKVLVLGGSVFLSKAVATEAVARGHDVTCANRGTSGSVPDGATLVVWDRTEPVPAELTDTFDVVVDVGRYPSWTRSAVAAFPSAHWVFVSTVNVYVDESTPGGRPGTLRLREPIHEDVDLSVDMEAYGPMKVACEQIVRDGVDSWMVVRPGLIVGPEDPSGRFTYWPARMADGGTVLAPGRPDDSTQVIDARDLAAWIVAAAESRTTGDYDGVGHATTMGEVLTAVATGCDAEVELTWVPQEFLTEQGVEPWAGPDSLPLWLPRPEYDGMTAHDATPSYDAGLVTRPVAETARDTLAWLRATPDAQVTGMSRQREGAVLAAWHSLRG
ncbi:MULTISPECIES: NAD-dependent epimerase/dehydratase family protein [unclassified Nocardioides]|uniref:NAD-dependent epimerase/dehydratase family protein n=1 Tax=unclassified Nocardioides TaxID=2615069 RepID=UPI0009EF931E|nr:MULTISPECIES: NAD-dependent epimerase/dehydratase family protein [unclassified Nocardioides]GAW51975.1 NAD-dependent epimerase/dehydratase [Nocardioides sp. PD653-B2]GAW56419.1 NAD-dependent epimerase/dehydratase [Nocardioides sp. PD653]